MNLVRLQLNNFRNHLNFQHDFSKNLTIFYGKNASGKTNLLEAIRVLSLSKSFRAKSDLELINWKSDFARAIGIFKKEGSDKKTEVFISKNEGFIQKIIKINDIAKKASDLVGQFITVIFCPEDLNLISASPFIRRKYFDTTLAQADKNYYRELLELRKISSNRNKLLFEIKEKKRKAQELDFWNKSLISLSKKIYQKRVLFINFLNSKLSAFYNQISQNGYGLKLEYLPSFAFQEDFENFEQNFEKEMNKKQWEEIKKVQTLVGPHRDDFRFLLSRKPLALFGSRGETRSVILALKLSELSFFEKVFSAYGGSTAGGQERPILLLDDIFSELDEKHRNSLANIVNLQQTIITTTEPELINKNFLKESEVLEIKNYVVHQNQ
jgi:DNA replication and repair protein RecF